MAVIDPSRMPASGWEGNVGVPGGIPTNYTQFCNVKVSIPGYGGALAVGDGETDDYAALQAAMSLCPNGQYVYIPEGDYYLSSGLGRGGINNFDGVSRPYSIVLKGAGPTKTRIFNHSPYSDTDTIGFAHNSAVTTTIVDGNIRGSNIIEWGGDPGFCQVGVCIIINRLNTASGFTPQGSNSYMGDSCSQVVKITAINGNFITFEPKLNEGYSGDYITIPISCPTRCGVEDMYIERITDLNGNMIHFENGVECWVKNVETRMCRRWHIKFNSCYRCEARENYVHETWEGGGDSGYGIGLFKHSCNCLVENNIMWRCRHSMIFEWGGQGNVYGYNFSFDPVREAGPTGEVPAGSTDYMMGDMATHGGNPRWNLFEGNVGCILRFDNILGGSDYMLAFRNQVRRKGLPSTIVACFGTDIQRYSYNATFSNVYETRAVGSVSSLRRWGTTDDPPEPPADPNIDPLSESTSTLNGEYDAETGLTTWTTDDHTLPDSYYLSGKPSWWDSGVWPSIGADLSDKFGQNPAYRRVFGEENGIDDPVFCVTSSGSASLLITF